MQTFVLILDNNHITQERKELIKGSYRDKHFNAGSILLGFGVFESIFGGLNTWFRTGKLFPGPHLFAGAGTTCIKILYKDKIGQDFMLLKEIEKHLFEFG